MMQYHLLPKYELFWFIGHANIGLDALIVLIEWFSTELSKKMSSGKLGKLFAYYQ